MKSRETLLRRALPFTVIASLGLTACWGIDSKEDTSRKTQERKTDAANVGEISDPIWTEDGRRVTVIPGTAYADEPMVVTEYCNGPDLMTITEQRVYKGSGGGVDRAVDHEWCDDDVLTPGDFNTPS